MAFPYFNKIEYISSKTEGFTVNTAANIANLKGRKFSVQNTETLHTQMLKIFQSTMDEISVLKKEIHSQTRKSNEEQMFEVTTIVTDFETRLSQEFNIFNDTLLTYYPTAKIYYGHPCIGPKMTPKIETSDPKVRRILENASYTREIRGDGNCFFSALFSTYIEKGNIERLIALITEDQFAAPELKEELLSTLFSLQENPSQLENVLKNNHKVLPFISYFRLLAATEMKKRKEDQDLIVFFSQDIELNYQENIQNKSYETLVNEYVLKMGKDASHTLIQILCEKLNFPVRIIDPKIGASGEVNVLDREEAAATFCRKDNHYFVLYPRQERIPAPIAQVQSQPLSQISQVQPQIEIPSAPVRELTVQCKLPPGCSLSIRGNGNLSWEIGNPLISQDGENWTYKPITPLQEGTEYKFVVNNSIWEEEDNHKIENGKFDKRTPRFNLPASISTKAINPSRFDTATRVIVHYAFNSDSPPRLFIRGNGPGLSWERNVELLYIGNKTWIYETQGNFENFEYKILLNNHQWESGSNRTISFAKKEEILPQF